MTGDWPRYGNCQDCVCSEKSLGVIFGPASSIATFQPASVSRLAAQPPVAPEPTTTASKGSFGTETWNIRLKYTAELLVMAEESRRRLRGIIMKRHFAEILGIAMQPSRRVRGKFGRIPMRDSGNTNGRLLELKACRALESEAGRPRELRF